MKIYLLAGEASGDIHGAKLVKTFKQKYPSCEIRGMGGKEMIDAGCDISFDYGKFSIMGFVEVIMQYRRIRKYFKDVENDIHTFSPDIIVFIDFPGFNLRLAKRLYKDYSLHYYIAPKAWAWNKRRIKNLKKYIKTVSCILPFEEAFFQSYGVNAKYVGNPSKEQVKEYIKNHPQSTSNEKYIALFPGSRVQEIERILPVMLDSIRKFPKKKYKISKASNLPASLYEKYITHDEDLVEENYALLMGAEVALVTSGTATLETALFGVPQVVCYIANPISYFIARRLVSIPFISLVNLIMDKEVVKELIQQECNVRNIKTHLIKTLDQQALIKIKENYAALDKLLGDLPASSNTVEFIASTLK